MIVVSKNISRFLPLLLDIRSDANVCFHERV
jgi:hypothetical protein